MALQDPRLAPAFDRAFRWVERAVAADSDLAPSYTALLRERLWALHQEAAAEGSGFVPVAVPVALSQSDTSLAAAACTAFHLAAVTAAPGGLASGSGGSGAGVPDLANVQQAFLSVAISFLGDLGDPAPAMRTAAFAARRLAGGRATALEAKARNALLDPAAALAQARLETGCAFACYAQVAAIAGGMPGESWTSLWSWGEAVGAARQLDHQAGLLGSAEPEASAQLAAIASQLREEAGRTLGTVWLPWGARPLLEAASRPGPSPAGFSDVHETA